ncbi:hypothetical protein [Proteiniclasticum sp.]|uniref:hypothetical protein n=1 Tax=Proteiniclasticum sp. TaxID=2053595 RepID=UPI0028A08661|nr:hypothetical protein [Proteiniclasticum sp.]
MSTINIENKTAERVYKSLSHSIVTDTISSKYSSKIINFIIESNIGDLKNRISSENVIVPNVYKRDDKIKIEKNSSKSHWYQETENTVLLDVSDAEYRDFIYKLIKRDEFEIGYHNETIRFIKREIKKGRDKLLTTLQQILITYASDDDVWIAILNILSNLSYHESEPYSMFIAGSALSRKNIRIKEMAVVMFEEWCNGEALEFLREMETGVAWLDKYIASVIQDIETEIVNHDLFA